jgi:hypothetical protein
MNRFLDKKIVKWTYDFSALPKSASFAAAQISEALDTITIANHPFETGDKVGLYGTTAATAPDAATAYYIIYVDKDTVALASSEANAFAGTKAALTAGSAAGCYLVKDNFGAIKTGIILPLGAIVTGGYVDVKTSLTSGGSATIAFSTGEGAADLLAATAVATLAANYTTAVLAGTPVIGSNASTLTAGTAVILQAAVGTSLIEMTANNEVVMTVAVASLSAGKLDLVLEYIV